VVVTDVAGNRDTVEHGVSGLVVPVDDPEPLADAIVELIRDPARRAAFAQAGAERLRALFDVREMADQTTDVYERLAAEKRRPARLLRRAAGAAA
jgi:glycosyltransferase involved in cell wall biosynthesis